MSLNSTFKKVYEKRKELLVSGYTFEALDGMIVPTVILKYIERAHSANPQLTIQKITNTFPLNLECYFKGGMNGLINVAKYRLTFKYGSNDILTETEQIYDKTNLAWSLFQIQKSIIYLMSANNNLEIKLRATLSAYDENNDMIKALQEQQIKCFHPFYAPNTPNLNYVDPTLQLFNIQNGYDLEEFQKKMQKLLPTYNFQFENLTECIKRFFYFAVMFRDNQNEERVQLHQLIKIIMLNTIENNHTFKKIQSLLKMFNY